MRLRSRLGGSAPETRSTRQVPSILLTCPSLANVTTAPPRALPYPPMEAELVRELPRGAGGQFEPKWDGFRGVLENLRGGRVPLWSRNARPLLRYFPELESLGENL